MADSSIPQEIVDWMNDRQWGAHHVEWHFVRRWDFWHAMAPTNPEIQAMVDAAVTAGWTRAAVQEGESGSGLDFLFMHRAMFHLLLQAFPHHSHYFRGWNSPPTDPTDVDDPVPGGAAFQPEKIAGISLLESAPQADFPNEDSWAMFLETNLRPITGDPLNRSPDLRTGIHNYLHNRWSDASSPVNLGDPEVNIFNTRFWKLHGWIDYRWWRFRTVRNLSDSDPTYISSLQAYVDMMGTHHHEARTNLANRQPFASRAFGRFFEFD